MEGQVNRGDFMAIFFGEAKNFLHLPGFESRIIPSVGTKVRENQK
jgi:hypothetical protein